MTSTAGKTSKLVRTERTGMPLSDFQSEIFRLEASTGRESWNLLIYGDSNVGKTHLTATIPGKNFWLVCEPGYKTAQRMGAVGHGRRITDSAAAWAAIEWLETRERYRRYQTVILDGFSTVQDKVRFNYAAEAFDINPAKRQHRNLPDRPDFYNTQNFMKGWIARLVDMPVNFIMTGHAYRTDETDVDLFVFPGIQGKVSETANSISGLMDAVGYYELKTLRNKEGRTKQVRRLHWQPPEDPDVKYLVGDKFGTLGPYMDNPTMPGILAKIETE